MQSLFSSVTSELSFKDHLLILLYQLEKLCVLKDLTWKRSMQNRNVPYLTNEWQISKTIFWLILFYELKTVASKDLDNEYAETSLLSLTNDLLKTIF